jgi:hypothetical protein
VWKVPRSRAGRDWLDLAAFLGVLATCVVLITVGHLTAAGLTAASGACVALYAAWNRWRTPPADGSMSSKTHAVANIDAEPDARTPDAQADDA